RPLLRSLEQARRSALENHVHRNARLGAWVLISARWYKSGRSRIGRNFSQGEMAEGVGLTSNLLYL
ncbi:hypothetical protein VQ045_20595, partial [Aurantimonas sp. E1-2-R+4]|uniref:hypothetical protein n=1 Tax=Aurantimonas sp. E1-2-R+4 TaxID=3113714 RepID=UPI002F9400A3